MERKKPTPPRHAGRRRPRWGVLIPVLVLTAVFVFSVYKVADKLLQDRRADATFRQLSQLRQQAPAPAETEVPDPEATPVPAATPIPAVPAEAEPSAPTEPELMEETAPEPLPEYAPLKELNQEFFGWLTIPALDLDYPVMQSPSRREYYLNRDFYGRASDCGTPFVDGRCPPEGNYFLIYGHLMKNKTIFGNLPLFADQAFYEENPVFRFDTVYEKREYQIMAAFYTRIYGEKEDADFRYYLVFDLTDPAAFNDYVSQVKALSLYDTGVEAEYGDELLTLSTCSHHTSDGRFVVVAKRIA